MLRSCREVTKLISQSLERQLNWRERLELWFHASLCRMCNAFRSNVATLRRTMQTLNLPSRPSLDLSVKDSNDSTAGETLSTAAKERILKLVQNLEKPNGEGEGESH